MTLSFINDELSQLKDTGYYNKISVIEGPQGSWVNINKQRMLNLCSNNYLGFANHPQLKASAIKAIEEYGVGPGAVRSIAGTTSLHIELEEKLTSFKEVESSLSFQSGFIANQAVIPVVVRKGDAILTDELNHASIIDGIRLTKADRHIYKHCDIGDLEDKLNKTKDNQRKLIITDGVFSMDGDYAPLDKICELAEEHSAILMTDDAHGEGVLGKNGRGIVSHFNLQNRVHIELGTMSKAFGVVGGYISGSSLLTELLQQKARPFLFSSAVTPPDAAACIGAIDILKHSDDLVKKLWSNAKYFQKNLQDLDFDIGKTQTPITPVIIGDEKKARQFADILLSKNIFATSIAYPTVPKGLARIRVMLSAIHSTEDLDYAISSFEEASKIVNL